MTWLKVQLERLITRFSVNQRLISAGQIHSLSRLTLVPQILVGRDYCQYALIKLKNVPRAKREQALKHQIDVLSLWPSVSYSVAWNQGEAQVWLWDNAELSGLIQNNHSTEFGGLYKPTFLAEVLHWQKPQESGLHLFKASHGYDLQYWNEGILQASQWYLNAPADQQIQRFARGQGLASFSSALAIVEPTQTEQPWPGAMFSLWEHFFERRSQIIMSLAAVSVLVMSLQLTAVVHWYWKIGALERQTAALAESANDLLTARSSARAANIEMANIERLFAVPNPLAAQQKVYTHLPATLKLSLQTWERNIDQVDMTVQGEIPDTLSLVRAFSQDGMKNVRVEPTPEANKYRIRLKLDGFAQSQQEPK